MATAFDFGANWLNFSRHALDDTKVVQAKEDFRRLMGQVDLAGKSFLDIGFGQGLSLFVAAEQGAKPHGCDINPRCAEATANTARFFPSVAPDAPKITVGSILDPNVVGTLRANVGGAGYDIVHSWGVLHHTGDMKRAIANAVSLVRPGGYFALAIYNRHITSPVWVAIKWFYCKCPAWMQRVLIGLFYPIIWLAKLAVTGENPSTQDRGMDFYFNVVDWVGGYPYEYASIDEVRALVEPYNFDCITTIPAQVPTGCNELLFKSTTKQ
ncbi:class I SAM-dependent methyltransferase [Dongia soli]|uniref:Class I SAM-dependent methyltransferase n=1 Tax=Dongia soli TaxID=600628 RepID=A0ABU5ECX0_9PROT|nr:class I SAM-dependent methyltransferase [Dongia soli]MDY0884063.1 class I SAM-dependent methyltransferase [Dongia soli]